MERDDVVGTLTWILCGWGRQNKPLASDAGPSERDEWQAAVQELVSQTIAWMKSVSSQWSHDLASAWLDQIGLYDADRSERGFLLTLVGVAVDQGVVGSGADAAVDWIASTARHQSADESRGCALALAICARNHPDVVLNRLQLIERNDYGRKTSGMLRFSSPIHLVESVPLK